MKHIKNLRKQQSEKQIYPKQEAVAFVKNCLIVIEKGIVDSYIY